MSTNFTAIAAVTLDGKIAKNSRHPSTWTSAEDKKFFTAELKKYDLLILGNNTFKAIENKGSGSQDYLIFSRTPLPQPSSNVRYFNPEVENFLNYITSKNYQNVAILGGTQIYNWFLAHDLINEIYITIEPLIFGAGLPLFSKGTIDQKFQLVSCDRLNAVGTLLLRYQKLAFTNGSTALSH